MVFNYTTRDFIVYIILKQVKIDFYDKPFVPVWVKHFKIRAQNYWRRVEKLLNLPELFFLREPGFPEGQKKEK